MKSGRDRRQSALRAGFEHRQEVDGQALDDHFGLRVAESDVELDDFWSVFPDHKPNKKHTPKRRSSRSHATDRRRDDLTHDSIAHLRGHDRRWRISAHAAGVGAGIPIPCSFVVLRAGERRRGGPIAESEEGNLFAIKEFLDDHLASGAFKLGQKRVHCALGLFNRGRDDHAFAACQSVGLDDDRRARKLEYGPWRRHGSGSGYTPRLECRSRGRSPWRSPSIPRAGPLRGRVRNRRSLPSQVCRRSPPPGAPPDRRPQDQWLPLCIAQRFGHYPRGRPDAWLPELHSQDFRAPQSIYRSLATARRPAPARVHVRQSQELRHSSDHSKPESPCGKATLRHRFVA